MNDMSVYFVCGLVVRVHVDDAPGYGTNRGLPHGVAGVRAPSTYFVWGADSAHGVHVFRMMRGVVAPSTYSV